MPVRRIPGSVKDDNGFYQKAPKREPEAVPPSSDPAPPSSSYAIHRTSRGLDDILNQQLLALENATQQLCIKSVTGLNKDEIQSLATLTKLTMELKAKENTMLDALSEDALKEIAKDYE